MDDHHVADHHVADHQGPPDESHAAQVPLPGLSDLPLQFRLSGSTCRIGLAGVAAARRQLAEQAERRAERERERALATGRRRGLSATQRRAA